MGARNVTRSLMGDPRPGRTPWAEPANTSVPAEGALALAPVFQPAPPSLADKPTLGSEEKGSAPIPLADAAPLRAIAPICTKGLTKRAPPTGEPIFERVNPRELLVEESYQRDLSDRSLNLIRKIVQEWDWRRFKPPVVAFADDGLRIIDGQHTAIAAASHPDIDMIPVMVVEAPELQARALAFIGHNRDRLQVTPMQLHHASVAAGDPVSMTIERVCADAGVTLVRSAHGAYRWKVGDSVAVAAIRGVIERQGEARTRQILQTLVAADLAPVAANEIKAAELLFTNPDYADQLDPLDGPGAAELAKAILTLGDGASKEAKVFAAAQCVPFWRALAITWFKKCRKRRKVQ